MAFSPLGRFNASAPLDPKIIAAGKAFCESLPGVPSGLLKRIYLHWAVAPFGCTFADYNVMADCKGGAWLLKISHDPRDNAPGLNNNAEASHTYHRNTGAVGIALAGMDGATEEDFGPDGVTLAGLEYLCVGAAALASRYGIDVAGTTTESPYANEPTILTHAEAADRPGKPAQYEKYGPASTCERWDLASFVPLPHGVSVNGQTATECGNALRARIHAYKVALQ
jgi:hypothetical protein